MECYIGKRRLDKAIELHKRTYPGGSQDIFSFTWLAYYLDPDAPRQGTPLAEHFKSKHGPERAEFFQNRLTQIGHADGISFSFDSKIGNTRDAHRLVKLAQTKDGVETVIAEKLYAAYFEGSADITDHSMLCDIGVEAGLDREVVKDWLKSDQGGEEVDQEAASAREGKSKGVPRYVIQGTYTIDGADDPSELLEVFHQIKSKQTDL